MRFSELSEMTVSKEFEKISALAAMFKSDHGHAIL